MSDSGPVDVGRLRKLLKGGATLREAARLLGIEYRRAVRYALQNGMLRPTRRAPSAKELEYLRRRRCRLSTPWEKAWELMLTGGEKPVTLQAVHELAAHLAQERD